MRMPPAEDERDTMAAHAVCGTGTISVIRCPAKGEPGHGAVGKTRDDASVSGFMELWRVAFRQRTQTALDETRIGELHKRVVGQRNEISARHHLTA